MPGVFQLSVDAAVTEAGDAQQEGVRAVLLFGLPEHKDEAGSSATDPDAPVQSAIRAIKESVPNLLVITDVCLCAYTSHGHCGIVDGNEIVNDPTVAQLALAAVSHAEAGADIVAPIRHDGRPGGDHPGIARRGRLFGHGDHVIRREVLLCLLRTVP